MTQQISKEELKEMRSFFKSTYGITTAKSHDYGLRLISAYEEQIKESTKWEQESRLQFKLFNDQIDETQKWRERFEEQAKELERVKGDFEVAEYSMKQDWESNEQLRKELEEAKRKLRISEDESEIHKGNTKVMVKESDSLRNQLQIAVEALKSLPNKIMEIQRFADTEELNFPMEEPTVEDQEEWFDRFIQLLHQHVDGVVKDELDAISQIGKENIHETR